MKVKQDLLTDFDMLLMVEKVIRGGICHAIHRCAKANKNTLKIMQKIENHHILIIGLQIIYMDGKNYMDGGIVTKLQWR